MDVPSAISQYRAAPADQTLLDLVSPQVVSADRSASATIYDVRQNVAARPTHY